MGKGGGWELREKRVLLTGATGGLGVVVARRLADAGAALALSARRTEPLDALAAELRARGARAETLACDLSDPEAAEALVGRADRALGPLDAVVSNAGIETCAAYTRHPRSELVSTINTNLVGPMVLVWRALRGMAERGSGRIVLVSSMAGKGPTPYQAAYAASKAGLVGLSQSLRAELAGTNVTVSVVCPSFVTGADDGMYVRMEREGFEAPRALGRAPAERCADAVLRALRTGLPELLVSTRPVRPLLALGALRPGLSERVVAVSGVTDFFRGVAASRGRL
jgi:short-subunit dehydrogenase